MSKQKQTIPVAPVVNCNNEYAEAYFQKKLQRQEKIKYYWDCFIDGCKSLGVALLVLATAILASAIFMGIIGGITYMHDKDPLEQRFKYLQEKVNNMSTDNAFGVNRDDVGITKEWYITDSEGYGSKVSIPTTNFVVFRNNTFFVAPDHEIPPGCEFPKETTMIDGRDYNVHPEPLRPRHDFNPPDDFGREPRGHPDGIQGGLSPWAFGRENSLDHWNSIGAHRHDN